MHHRTAVIGILLSLGTTPSAEAQGAGDHKAVAELMTLFNDLCLQRFPNDQQIQAYVTGKHLASLAEERIRQMLGTDPGIGWTQNTGFGSYTITIELPPYHTCAFRKQYADVPDVHTTFGAKLRAWAATRRGAKLTEQPMQTPQIGGIVSTALIFALSAPGLPDGERLLAIVTPFPQGGSEVRLARAIGNH